MQQVKNQITLYRQTHEEYNEDSLYFYIETLRDLGVYIITTEYDLKMAEKFHKSTDEVYTEKLETIKDRLDSGDEKARDIMEDYSDILGFVYLKKNGKANRYYKSNELKNNSFDSYNAGIIVYELYTQERMKTEDEIDNLLEEINSQLDNINYVSNTAFFDNITVTEDNVMEVIRSLEEDSDIWFEDIADFEEIVENEHFNVDTIDYEYLAFKLRKIFNVKEATNV